MKNYLLRLASYVTALWAASGAAIGLWLLIQGMRHGGDDWVTTVSFNRYHEGYFELVLFPLVIIASLVTANRVRHS